jgi:hypothetical protein
LLYYNVVFENFSDNEGGQHKLAKGVKNALKAKKAQLMRLLATPITPSGISLKFLED